jgi:wyosine [tRNA(Phe)-imidazoG37] synthetase (radical SAM superfamily)
MDRFVFGPVPSRRLGFSLGVDIIPRKYCNFDCIYCQIGKTTDTNVARNRFFEVEEVIKEIADAVQDTERVDFVTFSGSGEPTLNKNLGVMIKELKRSVSIPVAVITNSSLMWIEEVRNDLINADVVLPSLDAASDDVFKSINRPQANLELASIIEGIRDFRKNFKGKIWLEIMLIKDVNDSPDELQKLRSALDNLEVDKIHLNTVTRPPSERNVGPLNRKELEQIRRSFGSRCEIISSFEKDGIHEEQAGWTTTLVDVLKRRSLTIQDIVRITGASSLQVNEELNRMEKKGSIKAYRLGNDIYYTAAH